MNKTFEYLIYFSVYSLIILFIGKSSFGESDSVSKFFVGERKTGLFRLFFTFVGTWMSATSLLGFTGNIYQDGTGVIVVSVIPWFIGAVMLYAITDRLYEYDVVTIPQMLGERYQSRGLRITSALMLSGGYVLYLIMQIKGFGMAASSLLNIDYKVAVFLVYLFILYSTFGGYISVTKTDSCNLIMLTASILIIYVVIVGGVDQGWILSERMAEATGRAAQQRATEGYTPLMYITMFFGWGMGLAVNPQYQIRLISAKDTKTAKKMLIWALIFLAGFYFCLTQIGLGLRFLFPSLDRYCATDEIFLYAMDRLIDSRFSGFFLLSVIGACISTANSQLLLIGSMMSYDVAALMTKKQPNEDQILFWAQVFIFLGGTISLVFSIHPPDNILFFGADIWGAFAAVLTPLIYGMLCWKGGTRRGAWAAFAVGTAGILLLRGRELPVYWAFPATVCSCAAYVLVSVWEERRRHR